jgi:hypothetical protein
MIYDLHTSRISMFIEIFLYITDTHVHITLPQGLVRSYP